MASSSPKAARSLIWTGLESIGLSGVSFVTLVVLARYVSPADFGVASMALAVIQLLGIPLEMGFHDALVQKKDADKLHFSTAFVATTSLGVLLCALCWLCADLFSQMVHDPMGGEVLKWMSLSLPATGIGSAVVAWQRREFQFRSLAVRSLVARLLAAAIAIAMAMLGTGVWSLVAQQVLMVGLSTATLWALSDFRPSIAFSRTHFMELARFGAKATASLLLVFSIQRVFMLLVGTRFGPEQAGHLNLAFRAVDMLRDLMGQAVSQLALPLFSRHQDNRPVLFEKFGAAVTLTCGLAMPVFAVFAACAPEVVAVVFGPKWVPAIPYIVVLALLTFQSFARMFASPLMSSLGYPQYSIPSQIMQMSIIAAGMLTIGGTSTDAAMGVWVFRAMAVTPIDMWRMKRTIGLGFGAQIPNAARTLLIALLAAAAAKAVGLWVVPGLPALPRLVAMAATGGLLYIAMSVTLNRPFTGRLFDMARTFRVARA
ncbi:lipopolysaccharide biosynthesis protein [Rhizobacter sp. Root1221]|uniref:lipopolysaccharide biosynthesis protein n=1 Tax=Rhizobacter sp. Root1221 TaxID=1736433 RepID=UPI0006F4E39D|nr:lipopolysaccharide biosynthesis protein [Rhizobacter sp. Root1221]KQV95863.1 hypothetical protein ASC87_04815 [Rhizobacter sp. Root1221]